MTEPTWRVVRVGWRAAVLALPLSVGLGWFLAGSKGVWGALLGEAIPVVFLAITAVVVAGASRLPPGSLGAVVLASWLLKIVVLITVLTLLRGQQFYHRSVFFGVFLVSAVGFLLLEAVVVSRSRIPYTQATGAENGRITSSGG